MEYQDHMKMLDWGCRGSWMPQRQTEAEKNSIIGRLSFVSMRLWVKVQPLFVTIKNKADWVWNTKTD